MKFIYLNAAIFSVEEIKEIAFVSEIIFYLKDGSERHCDSDVPDSIIENEIIEFLQNKNTFLNLNQVFEFWFYDQQEKKRIENNANPES